MGRLAGRHRARADTAGVTRLTDRYRGGAGARASFYIIEMGYRHIAGVTSALAKLLQPRIEALRVLVVDDDHYMRKVVRTMLNAIGVRSVTEAAGGAEGLAAIRDIHPDLVILDWEMPQMDGPEFVRRVRSPGEFPMPDVPIIMLSGHGDRWRVVEAARVGAHEYLLKPVSTKALLDRIIAVIGQPRPTVRIDGYYGPLPRRLDMLDDAGPNDKPAPAADVLIV
jgi:two-component system chemotaxis response regulator CheY